MDDLLARLARFNRDFFPRYEKTYRRLVDEGRQPKTLFIGCSDSRIVPYALMDAGRGELFIARDAALPGPESPQVPRRVEQRSIVLQLERLMSHPMVARRVRAGKPFLHGWYCVTEDGRVLVFDAVAGAFVPHGAAFERARRSRRRGRQQRHRDRRVALDAVFDTGSMSDAATQRLAP